MKSFSAVFFILSFCSLFAQDQRDYYRLDCDITHVSFSNQALVCAAGTNGVIMRSLDTGATWQQFYTGTSETIRSVAFFDNNTGLAIGAKSTTICTINGGKKWTRVELPGNPDFYGMALQGNSAILTGKGGAVFYSQDQGESWKASDPFTTDSVLSIAFSDNLTAIATTGTSKIFRTTDGGKSWTEIPHHLSKLKIIGGAGKRGDGAVFIPFADSLLTTTVSTTYDGGLTWKDSTYKIAAKAMAFTSKGYGLFLADYNFIYRTTDSSKPAFSAYFDPLRTAPEVSLRFDAIAMNNEKTAIATGNLKTMYRTTDGGLTWTLLSYFRTKEKAYLATSITFLNDSVGWVGAYDENLFRTRDGGATWLPQPVNNKVQRYVATITDVTFFDEKHGIISSDNDAPSLYITDDGGETMLSWSEYFKDTSSLMDPNEGMLQFLDPSFGLIFGRYWLQSTKDTGRTWQHKTIPYDSKESIVAGYARDTNTYFMAVKRIDIANGFPEETAKILRTFNGGVTWETISIPDMSAPFAIHGFTDGSILLGGRKTVIDTVTGYKMNNRIYRTIDNFTTFELVEKSDNIYTWDMDFYGDEGYAVQFPRSVLYTGDKGKSWKNVAALKNIGATDVSMPSRNTVYFVNDSSMLVKGVLRDTLTSLVEEQESKVSLRPANEIWMREAYPNPFSSKVKIKIYYSLALSKEDISLKVFNSFGENIADITQNFLQSDGNNPAVVEWNAQGLPGGLYFVQVKGGNSVTTLPIVLMR